MRRALVLTALALAACAKSENTPVDTTTAMAPPPAPAPVVVTPASWAGTWEGTAMPMTKDTVVTTLEMTATATKDGWTMKLPNGAAPKLTVVEIPATASSPRLAHSRAQHARDRR